MNANKWFDFIQYSLENENAFLVKHNLAIQAVNILFQLIMILNKIPMTWKEKYSLATPSLLQKEGIKLTSETFKKINNIKDGQVLAMLPRRTTKK